MPPYLQTQTYKIMTLSPICIQGGDGSGDYGQSFIRPPGGTDFLYLLDPVKLQQCLFEDYGGLSTLKQFAAWLEHHEKGGINAFFQDHKINFDYAKIPGLAKGKVYSQQPGGSDKYFIRNGRKRAYIPGSSLKGAMRTALLWKVLQTIAASDRPGFKKKLEDFLEKQTKDYKSKYYNKEKNKFKEFFAKEIIEDIFQNYHLKSPFTDKKHNVDYLSPFTDLLRAVKVKDTTELGDKQLSRGLCRVLSLNRANPYYKNKPKKPELIEFRVESYFSAEDHDCPQFHISLDRTLLADFMASARPKPIWGEFSIPFDDLEGLMAIVFEFYQTAWDRLAGIYAPYYQTLSQEGAGRQHGKVKKFFSDRGFGFINKGGEEQDFFFHIKSVAPEYQQQIDRGVSVTFTVGRGQKGLEARNIKVAAPAGLNLNHLAEFYKINATQKMRLGWGSGLLATTVALLFYELGLEEKLVELRDQVISGDGQKHGDFAPVSARVLVDGQGNPEYPLGWVRLEKIAG